MSNIITVLNESQSTAVHAKLHQLGLHHHIPDMDMVDGDVIGREYTEFESNESEGVLTEALYEFDVAIRTKSRGWLW